MEERGRAVRFRGDHAGRLRGDPGRGPRRATCNEPVLTNLAWVTAAACEIACRERLDRMLQIHLALGKDQLRLQRLVIFLDRERGRNSLRPSKPIVTRFPWRPPTPPAGRSSPRLSGSKTESRGFLSWIRNPI